VSVQTPARRSAWFAVLTDRRMISLFFVVLVVAPSFLLLARWQVHRLDERKAANSIVTTNEAKSTVPVDAVMTPGANPDVVGNDLQWRHITATGYYDQAATQLVRQRTQDGSNGYWVMTPLITAHGVLAVNRGWIAAGSSAISSPTVPAAPTGTVSVLGRVQPTENAGPRPSDLPTGQVTGLDVRAVVATGPVYPGYIQLLSSTPAEIGTPALLTIPEPPLDDGPHLSYALQWVTFAIIAIGGFVVLLRGEARRRREDQEELVSELV
jgi:cytochrome oxidase assembly protein ShyY1